jgi:hypothetical protein
VTAVVGGLPEYILFSLIISTFMLAGSLAAALSLFLSFSELSLAGSMAAAQGLFGSKRIRPHSGEVCPPPLLLYCKLVVDVAANPIFVVSAAAAAP